MPCFGEKSHFFKCHFADSNPFQARSASLLPKKPWKHMFDTVGTENQLVFAEKLHFSAITAG